MIYLFRELERASYKIVRVENVKRRAVPIMNLPPQLHSMEEKLPGTLLKALSLLPCQG